MAKRIENVPVKMAGVIVGRATVSSDGIIEMTVRPSLMGGTLYQGLIMGLTAGLSISPISSPITPAIPPQRPRPKGR